MRRHLWAGLLMVGITGHAIAQTPTKTATQAWVDQTNQGTVGVITGGVDGTYVRIGTDLLNILDNGDTLRILPIIGRGSLQNIADLLFLKGVDVAIVQSDVLAYAKMKHLYPGVEQSTQFITRLYNEEVHILARADIKTLADLKDQPVNIDRSGSGTAMTSLLMFDAYAIEPDWRTDDQAAALEKLRDGKIAAMIYVVGQPAKLFADLPEGSNLHFLPVELIKPLEDVYETGVITSADYPTLVPAGNAVQTLAVGSVMAVYGWPVGSERYRKVARFVDAFFDNFAEFQKPPRHRKWLEVALLVEVPGWKRFPEANDWIRRRLQAVPKDFTTFLATVPELSQTAKERLLLRNWQAIQGQEPIPTINVYAKKPPHE